MSKETQFNLKDQEAIQDLLKLHELSGATKTGIMRHLLRKEVLAVKGGKKPSYPRN